MARRGAASPGRRGRNRLLRIIAVLFAGVLLLAAQPRPPAVVLDVNGAIGPASASYIAHGLRDAAERGAPLIILRLRSEEHTSELQSLMRISYAVFCLKKKNRITNKKQIKS